MPDTDEVKSSEQDSEEEEYDDEEDQFEGMLSRIEDPTNESDSDERVADFLQKDKTQGGLRPTAQGMTARKVQGHRYTTINEEEGEDDSFEIKKEIKREKKLKKYSNDINVLQ